MRTHYFTIYGVDDQGDVANAVQILGNCGLAIDDQVYCDDRHRLTITASHDHLLPADVRDRAWKFLEQAGYRRQP